MKSLLNGRNAVPTVQLIHVVVGLQFCMKITLPAKSGLCMTCTCILYTLEYKCRYFYSKIAHFRGTNCTGYL